MQIRIDIPDRVYNMVQNIDFLKEENEEKNLYKKKYEQSEKKYWKLDEKLKKELDI